MFHQILAVTLDTTSLTSGIQDVLQQVFDMVPIGIAIFAPVAAIVGGLFFGQKLVGLIVGALSKFGGGGK